MTHKDIDVLERLSDRHQPIVELAVDYAENRLSAEQSADFRARLESDAMFRAVAQPILDSWANPEEVPAEQFQHNWNELRRSIGLSTPTSDTGLDAFEERVRGRSGIRRWRSLKVAAAIVLFAIGAPVTVFLGLDARYWDHRSTAENVTADVSLPDGSMARLSPGTSIKYLKGMTSGRGTFRREVYMYDDGTATFQVNHVGTEQFEVHTSHALITAVGTRFVVHNLRGFTEVTVEDGRVTVAPMTDGTPTEGTEATTLEQGMSARVHRHGIVVAPAEKRATP